MVSLISFITKTPFADYKTILRCTIDICYYTPVITELQNITFLPLKKNAPDKPFFVVSFCLFMRLGPVALAKYRLSQADALWRHLDKFVVGNKLKRLLKAKYVVRRQFERVVRP